MAPRIGIALGGGSSKGMAHIGVLEVLEEEGIKLSCVGGTSIGALVGAIYAAEPDAARLRERARALLESDAFSAIGFEFFVSKDETAPNLFRRVTDFIKKRYILGKAVVRPSLVDGDKIVSLITASLPDVEIEELKLPFACVALDLVTGEDVVFTSGPLIPAVLASVSIPGLFPCLESNGRVLVDGAATASIPVDAVRKLGADVVIAVDLLDALSGDFNRSSGLDINFRVDDIVKRRLNLMRVRSADVIVRPKVGSIHWADFDRLDFCVERGREATLESLSLLREKLRPRKRFRFWPF